MGADVTTDQKCSSPFSEQVRIERDQEGTVRVNVPRSVIHHSPDGFECGYGGSGPADLSLAILAAFLPGDEVKCWKGSCSQAAWDLHQLFKRDIIAGIKLQKGESTTLSPDMIRAYIEAQGAGQ